MPPVIIDLSPIVMPTGSDEEMVFHTFRGYLAAVCNWTSDLYPHTDGVLAGVARAVNARPWRARTRTGRTEAIPARHQASTQNPDVTLINRREVPLRSPLMALSPKRRLGGSDVPTRTGRGRGPLPNAIRPALRVRRMSRA